MWFNIIGWILLGGLAGWVANTLTKHETQMGLIANIIVGIAGAFIGGFLMNLAPSSIVTEFNLNSLFIATFSAGLLLFLVDTARRAV